MTKAAVKRKNSNFWERNRKSDGYLLKKVTLNFAAKVCRFVLLFGMCFMILQPILNKISVSFMEEQDFPTSSSDFQSCFGLVFFSLCPNATLWN